MRAMIARVVTIAFSICASGAPAQERCLATRYQMPPTIADDMRPYLLCGLISGQHHAGVQLNGVDVSMAGGGLQTCGDVRSRAFEASERRLASTMRDSAARRAFLEVEFEKADQFMRTAAAADDLEIGDQPAAPQCRDSDAQNR
jgi:hypothetical protein